MTIHLSMELIMDDMGSFRADVEIENPARPGERQRVGAALVETGAELSWFPREVLEALGIRPARLTRFRQATGEVVERWTGVAIVHVGAAAAGDQVVFGETGDLVLLGSRSLEGLNLIVDPVNKRLIDAGAMPAAAGRAA